MRDRSKRIAVKGLELACFVAERLECFPGEAVDGFAFEWEPQDDSTDDEPWGGEDDGIEKHQVRCTLCRLGKE